MELNELYKQVLHSSSNWMSSKIEDRNNRVVFQKAIEHILKNVYFHNMEDLEIFLDDKVMFYETLLNRQRGHWWELHWDKTNEYHLKANELALDICQSFLIRFYGRQTPSKTLLIKWPK